MPKKKKKQKQKQKKPQANADELDADGLPKWSSRCTSVAHKVYRAVHDQDTAARSGDNDEAWSARATLLLHCSSCQERAAARRRAEAACDRAMQDLLAAEDAEAERVAASKAKKLQKSQARTAQAQRERQLRAKARADEEAARAAAAANECKRLEMTREAALQRRKREQTAAEAQKMMLYAQAAQDVARSRPCAQQDAHAEHPARGTASCAPPHTPPHARTAAFAPRDVHERIVPRSLALGLDDDTGTKQSRAAPRRVKDERRGDTWSRHGGVSPAGGSASDFAWRAPGDLARMQEDELIDELARLQVAGEMDSEYFERCREALEQVMS